MSLLDRPPVRLGIPTLLLFTTLASDAVRNSIGWWGFGVVALICVGLAIALLVHNRHRLSLNSIPIPLLAFLILAVVSIAWSYYRLSSLLGVTLTLMTTAIGLAIGVTLSWPELLRVLGWVLRFALLGSLVFEFVVAAFVRHPVFPVWVSEADREGAPKLLYWSRNLLFEGDKIQGLVGNSSLLAMLAILGVIVFALQLASRSVRPVPGVFWLLVAALVVALTRSATIFIGLAVVAAVVLAAVVVRRTAALRAGAAIRFGLVAVIAAGAILALVFRVPLLASLGKSADFTGRIGIWEAVIGLAEQRPGFGWGWISYWVPWAAPFDHLIVRGGVQVMHAHNAWLDVWLQLGVLGLVVFGALVLSTLVRSWQIGTQPVLSEPGRPGRFEWLSLLPVLVLTAQLVQSLAESRILVEGGWVLLIVMAVMTKRGFPTPLEPPLVRTARR